MTERLQYYNIITIIIFLAIKFPYNLKFKYIIIILNFENNAYKNY